MIRGDFEYHVTVSGEDAAVAALAAWARERGVKFTHIVLARGEVPSQPMLTVRAGTIFMNVTDRPYLGRFLTTIADADERRMTTRRYRRRRRSNGRSRTYPVTVTQRCHDAAVDRLGALTEDSRAAQHEILGVEREYVVYDDRPSVDAGWIHSSGQAAENGPRFACQNPDIRARTG